MTDVSLLRQADQVLSKCGRAIAPAGMSAVCFPRGIPIQAVFPVTPSSLSQTITREISGDTTFLLRAISTTSSATTALSIQIQLPNGRFLLSNLADVLTFAGYGSWKYLLTEDLECPPGTKITVTLVDTNTIVAQPIMLLFEGADRYLLKRTLMFNSAWKGGLGEGPPRLASDLPRYRINANQNIMAPCWMGGEGPETPLGYQDEEFTYCSEADPLHPQFSIAVTATNPTGTLSIPIDQATDFLAYRLMFKQTVDGTVTLPGLFLGRMRDSSGYALMDDYLDLVGILNGAELPKGWRIEKGGQILIDVELVGATGTGNAYLVAWLKGVRRRKVS